MKTKRTWKIGNYTFWEDTKYKYTLCGQNLDCPKMDTKRSRNLYRWDPRFDTPTYGKLNTFECPVEIVMRAFVIIFSDVKEYSLYYNAIYGNKNTTNANTTNSVVNNTNVDNNTVNILVQALRQQAEMYEKALQQQIALNNANIENLIAIATGGVQQNVDTSEPMNDFTVEDTDTDIDTDTDVDIDTDVDTTIVTADATVVNNENDVEVVEKKSSRKPGKLPMTLSIPDDDEDYDDIE